MKLKLNLSSKILIILITLLIVLNVLDILLTQTILHYGGEETNVQYEHFNTTGIRPIDYVQKIGYSFLMGAVVLVQYWVSLRKNSKFGVVASYVMLIVLNLFYTYVVVNNIQVLIVQKQTWEYCQHIGNIS